MTFRTLDDAAKADGGLAGKTALVRVDFNVPMEAGKVTDDTRLRAALPTINALRDAGARVALLAHFDRPKGKVVPSMSLQPVVDDLEVLLGGPVRFASDCVGDAARAMIDDLDIGGVILLENVRFHAGEESNDPAFAQQLAELGDLYVNDAFSAAHRAHASTEGLARLLPAYAGESMRRELDALDAALGNPQKPVLGIVGGSKEVKPGAETRTVLAREEIGDDEKILDAGPLTVEKLIKAMALSRTLIWNGPLGVFEVPPFDAATVKAAQAAAKLAGAGALVAVAGGGDTVAALNHAGVADDMTFVSTAGGAFLEWMEGKPLPGVEALRTA